MGVDAGAVGVERKLGGVDRVSASSDLERKRETIRGYLSACRYLGKAKSNFQ